MDYSLITRIVREYIALRTYDGRLPIPETITIEYAFGSLFFVNEYNISL